MKAFEIKYDGETDIVAANTNIHALRYLCEYNSQNIIDGFEDTDSIREIPKEEWSGIKIKNTDFNKDDPNDTEFFTLDDLMGDIKEPAIISSTTYE